jgi:transglutaminase-like putative cysteine protease/thioredoxin-like negative regulator of GroEL
LRILPEDERAAVRTARQSERPITQADVHAALHLRLGVAWSHYYARRHLQTRLLTEGILADAPDFLPAQRLRAVLDEDLGLPHRAVARLQTLVAQWPDRIALRRGLIASLQSAGRVEEAIAALEALQASPHRRPDDAFQLATLRATRDETNAALQLLDGITKARPDLLGYALEAAEIAMAAGRRQEAILRLQTLADVVPGDAEIARQLASLYVATGAPERAIAILRTAEADDDVQMALERLTQTAAPPRLGPELQQLRALQPASGAPAHVLYHHARTTVDDRGLAVRHVRRVVRIQTEEGARRFARWQLPYVPTTQRLDLLTARLYREGAPPASPSRSDRDLSEPEYRLYYDLRAEILDFPPPRPGDVIEVVWRLADTDPDPAFPGYYGELAYLQEVAPRAWSVVEIEGPASLNIEVVPRGVKIQREGTRIWARNVPGLPLEAGMPGPSTVRAYVHVSTAQDWAEINTRYRALLGERDQPTAALKTLAEEWGGQGDTRAVLGRLYAAVAARTRYVGLEFGVRSFLPAQPAVTLARGYGDCKDKATLLIALARARGIDAHLTLVRTRPAGAIADRPASFAVFDHAIVYVPELDVFLDPTIDRNDPWTLPPGDQGAVAFVIDVDKTLRTLPMDAPAANRSAWGITGTLGADGRARGRLTWTTRGQAATVARRRLEAEGTRKDFVGQLLARRFPGAAVEPTQYDGLSPAFDPVVVGGTVDLPPFRAGGGGFDIPLGGAAWNTVGRFAQAATREADLVFDVLRQEALQLQLTLPAGMRAKTPAPVRLTSPFGTLQAEARSTGDRLSLTVQLALREKRIKAKDYVAFRAWLAQVDRALATVVEVRP